MKLLKRVLLKSWPKYGPEYVTETSHGFCQILHEVASVFPHICHDVLLPAHSPTILPHVEYATSQKKRKIDEEQCNSVFQPSDLEKKKTVMWNDKNISECDGYSLWIQ